MSLLTELGLIYRRESYKRVAPNGASALQHELFNKAKSLLAPKARHSHQSLGQRRRVMKIKKTLALKARFTSGTPVGSALIELTPPKAFGVVCMAI